MSLKLFNSLTKQEEVFTPLQEGTVKMYTCGPTVYNYAHVGNFFAYLSADTLFRWLKFGEQYDVKWVMNITDIDDKTIRDSKLQYPGEEPMQALSRFCGFYADAFLADLQSLNITGVSEYPRPTKCIDAQQDLVRKLYERGYAYIADGSVYFSIDAYKKDYTYGRLVHIDEGFKAGARVDQDEYEKANAADFVLWKGYKKGEPFWQFSLPSVIPAQAGIQDKYSIPYENELKLSDDINIKKVETQEEWEFVHNLREKEIFERYHPERKYWRENPDDRAPENTLLILKKGEEFIGTVRIDNLQRKDSAFAFRLIAIVVEHRGKGFGKALVQLAEIYAISQGAKQIYINSQETVVDFYKELGYQDSPWREQSTFSSIPLLKTLQTNDISLPGRPGWHLECSAMEEKILGLPFDIHTGGVDLKFPHHEDEIAQSCGGYGIDPTKYWMHNGHLLVEGRKMSKSLGNFFRLKDLWEQGWETEVIRLAMVTNHYRKDFNFTQNGLHAMKHHIAAIRDLYAELQNEAFLSSAKIEKSHIDTVLKQKMPVWESAFQEAFREDLNTAQAFSIFIECVRKSFKYKNSIELTSSEELASEEEKSELRKKVLQFIDFASNVFGVDFKPKSIEISQEIIELVEQQKQAKANKDFAKADEIRDQLKLLGFTWDIRKNEIVKL